MKRTGMVVGLFAWAIVAGSVAEVGIATPVLPDGDVRIPYSIALTATNGTPPYRWDWRFPGYAPYAETSEPNSFSATGVAQGWQADENMWQLTLPFDFPFFGSSYSSCWVDSDGAIWFDVDCGIAALMHNLDTTWGDIYIDTTHATEVTIRWEGTYYYNTPPVSFSVTLADDGSITMKYGSGNAYGGDIGVVFDDVVVESSFSQDGSMGYADNIVFQPVAPADILLAGLSLSTNGVISGTPTSTYSNEVLITVVDDLGESADRWFELVLYDDRDGDGMLDAWELQMVDDNPTDGIETIYDVLRDGNYDGDTFSNIEEFLLGFDPVVPGGDPLDTVEEGLELLAVALTNEFDRVYASLIDGCFETVVAAEPSNYAARVYRAASQLVNLLNHDGQDGFLEEFGFSSSWDFEITGEFDIANTLLPDAVVDFLSTNLLPAIDASYADLEVIPTNWSGTAEISTNYFPVDETIYADIGDVTAAMSALKLLRSKVLTLAAQSLNVDYEKLLMPVDGPVAAITLDGLTNDWAGIPVQLLGEYDSVVEYVKGARSASSIYLLVQLAHAEIPVVGAEGEIYLGVDSSVEVDFFPYWGRTNIWFSETDTTTTEIGVVSSNRTIEIEIPVPDGIAISNASISWLGVEYLPVGAEWWMSSWEDLDSPFSSPVEVVLQNHPDFMEMPRSPLDLSSAKTNLNEAIDLFQLANELIQSRTDALMHFIEYDPTNETERVEFFNRLQQVELSLASPQPVSETNSLGEVVFEQVVHLGAFYQPVYLNRSMLPEFWKIPSQPLDGTFPDPTFGGVLPGMTPYKFDEYLRKYIGGRDADGDGLPNGWEYLYCGHPTNCIAQLDDDNDGQSNFDEYISGMDPTNAASCFRAVFNVQDSGGSSDIVISWEAAEGRVYDVHWSPALDQDFQLLETGIEYPMNCYTDTLHRAVSTGFYRVIVRRPGEDDWDADGLPDDWERHYLGRMDAADANTDSDGDGQDNIREYIAGTDPADADSFFALVDAGQVTAGFVVEWYSMPDRTYSVKWARKLGEGFQLLETEIDFPQNSYTDTVHGAEAKGYYKVDVRRK